jgi:hypothetical protein
MRHLQHRREGLAGPWRTLKRENVGCIPVIFTLDRCTKSSIEIIHMFIVDVDALSQLGGHDLDLGKVVRTDSRFDDIPA